MNGACENPMQPHATTVQVLFPPFKLAVTKDLANILPTRRRCRRKLSAKCISCRRKLGEFCQEAGSETAAKCEMCKNIEVGISHRSVFEESSSPDSIDRSIAPVSRVGSARIDLWPTHTRRVPSRRLPLCAGSRPKQQKQQQRQASREMCGLPRTVSSSNMHHAKLPEANSRSEEVS